MKSFAHPTINHQQFDEKICQSWSQTNYFWWKDLPAGWKDLATSIILLKRFVDQSLWPADLFTFIILKIELSTFMAPKPMSHDNLDSNKFSIGNHFFKVLVQIHYSRSPCPSLPHFLPIIIQLSTLFSPILPLSIVFSSTKDASRPFIHESTTDSAHIGPAARYVCILTTAKRLRIMDKTQAL